MDSKSRQTMRIVATASIILNLFFVAIIGGHFWRIHHEQIAAPAGLLAALARAEAGLSHQDATRFDAILRQNAPHYIAAARQLSAARDVLRQQVIADNYDPEKTRQALTNWRAAWNVFLDTFDNTLVEALSKVSPEGRRHLSNQHRSEALSR